MWPDGGDDGDNGDDGDDGGDGGGDGDGVGAPLAEDGFPSIHRLFLLEDLPHASPRLLLLLTCVYTRSECSAREHHVEMHHE